MCFRKRLLSTTFVPLVMGVGLVVVGCESQSSSEPTLQVATACSPCAAANPCAAACNPCAAACNPCAAACNPCAAACNPCNPCAAACGACNPCAAAACNPCAAKECYVPRLKTASACNPCNPCAAACNPCAAACNPCAAACNPCAAACNPCAAACNPCAAACNPCNPCAAAACNPCAASACNPCAAACNPCNPCAALAPGELTTGELRTAYDCVKGGMQVGYAKSHLKSDSGLDIAGQYQDWTLYNTQPYVSSTHGGRFVNNYGDSHAKAYSKFEHSGVLPAGALLVKDSFKVSKGNVVPGPLFIMEKMPAGFNADSGNWRYTMVLPGGKVFGTTNGKGSGNVAFCIGCHMSAEDTDSLLYLPEEYRASN